MKRLLSLALIVSLTFSVTRASAAPKPLPDLKLQLTLPWPDGLPGPMRGPVEGSIILPPALAVEISRHLEWGDKLPGLAQAAMDDALADKDRFIAEAEARRKDAEDHQGVPVWVLPTGIIGGIILGVLMVFAVKK